MIKQLLQHLNSLQVDLATINSDPEFEIADRVAAIAYALRRAAEATEAAQTQPATLRTAVAQQAAA